MKRLLVLAAILLVGKAHGWNDGKDDPEAALKTVEQRGERLLALLLNKIKARRDKTGDVGEEETHIYDTRDQQVSCTKRGEDDQDGRVQICSTCWYIKTLPVGYFPPILNELRCDTDTKCLSGTHDGTKGAGTGQTAWTANRNNNIKRTTDFLTTALTLLSHQHSVPRSGRKRRENMQHKVVSSTVTMILLCCLCAVEGAPSRKPRINLHPKTSFLRKTVPRLRRQAESGAESKAAAVTTGANVTSDVTTHVPPTIPLNRTRQSASETVNEVDIDKILETMNTRLVEPVSDHPEGYPEGLLGPQRFMMAVPPPGVEGVVPQLSAKTGDGQDVSIPIKDIAEEAQAEILRTRCYTRSSKELFNILRERGEFNRRYMAVSREDARKFPNVIALSETYGLLAFPVSSRQVKIDEINTRYVLPESLARGVVLPEVLNISRRIIRDTGSTEVDYCLERGTMTEDGYKRLCTVCAATTDLGEDYFPRYINEAICSTDSSDRGCFMVQGYGHGTCKQGTFSVSILRRKGQCSPTVRDGTRVYLEEWEVYSQQIRLFCECMINQHSTFAMFV
uniref:Uncharacterized protein n=1 Tax=Branchiostoma floridae TaxID=7739 RepID=C3ZGG5_BRAFL|eukprot:XP_002592335.1 hypothetical protein BRAFLDRAFT_101221 [Branchiostoma floridae]